MVNDILNDLIKRYPPLEQCREDITKAYILIKETYDNKGKLLCCGNGGSSADCDHLVGELMKGFLKKRPLSEEDKEKFEDLSVADGLQKGLPAISLTTQSGLMTAFENDCNPALVYAQQVFALASENDILIAFSTSGNSKNVVYGLDAANAAGIKSVAITGIKESKCSEKASVCIKLPSDETFKIQEYTLPVYHALAAMIEETYFDI